jgi:hypothetical protein
MQEIGRRVEATRITDDDGRHRHRRKLAVKTEEEDVEMSSYDDASASASAQPNDATRRHRGWKSLPVSVYAVCLFFIRFLFTNFVLIWPVVACKFAFARDVSGRVAPAPGS